MSAQYEYNMRTKISNREIRDFYVLYPCTLRTPLYFFLAMDGYCFNFTLARDEHRPKSLFFIYRHPLKFYNYTRQKQWQTSLLVILSLGETAQSHQSLSHPTHYKVLAQLRLKHAQGSHLSSQMLSLPISSTHRSLYRFSPRCIFDGIHNEVDHKAFKSSPDALFNPKKKRLTK